MANQDAPLYLPKTAEQHARELLFRLHVPSALHYDNARVHELALLIELCLIVRRGRYSVKSRLAREDRDVFDEFNEQIDRMFGPVL